MSRHGYSDDIDQWDLIKWRGQVASAIRGKRGQALLIDLVKALDVMPTKELISEKLVTVDGEVCALGAVGQFRGTKMPILDRNKNEWDGDDFDSHEMADLFNVAHQLAAEVMWQNDEGGRWDETPEQRWDRVRRWAMRHIQPVAIEERK
jgi:hypothetical protein